MTRGERRILYLSTCLALSFAIAGVMVRDITLWFLLIEVVGGLLFIVILLLLFNHKDQHLD